MTYPVKKELGCSVYGASTVDAITLKGLKFRCLGDMEVGNGSLKKYNTRSWFVWGGVRLRLARQG